MSGFGIRTAFDIGRKTLRAQLAGLNITGNNIANVNTEGYTRQELGLSSSLPIRTTEGIFGTGVEVDGVRRIRDQLIDRQLRSELQTKGQYESLERILSHIETIVNEPSETGLRTLMSEFFNNFSELANKPEDHTIRFNIKEQAQILTRAFHSIDGELASYSDDVNFEIERKVDELNTLLRRTADLNSQIVALEGAAKGGANDLRDSRDRGLNDISEIIDNIVIEKQNGAVEIGSSSMSLLTSNFPAQFEVEKHVEGRNFKSTILDKENGKEIAPLDGALTGLLKARNEVIPYFRDRFNDLAKNLIESVNSIHKNGVGLKGSLSEVPKNNVFFKGTNANDIEVADAILQDVNAIGAAIRTVVTDSNGNKTVEGSPGDNRIALEIAEIKTKLIFSNGTESLTDYFNSIISDVGMMAGEAQDTVENQTHMITQFKNLRDSTSAVSLDEEFVSLIKYQRGFQAGAKIVTTIDEMYQSLINM